jgi:hypothetical protein
MYLVESVLQILNFDLSWTGDMQHDPFLGCQAFEQVIPLRRSSKEPILYSKLCGQASLAMFCDFTPHHVYKIPSVCT